MMGVKTRISNSFYLLTILICSGANGVDIQAYQHKDFTELPWKTAACTNIPEENQEFIYSIKNDTCTIAYDAENSKSIKSQKYTLADNILSEHDYSWIKSFHICKENEGGSQLHLDLTEHLKENDLNPDVIDSYRNLCSCINIPRDVIDSYWSINNHHNSLMAYYEKDCKENFHTALFIAAGHNSNTRNIGDLEVWYDDYIMSLGPDPSSEYFQISCNSSHTTTVSLEDAETSTASEISADYSNNRFQVLKKQFLDLQTHIGQLAKIRMLSKLRFWKD